MDMSQAQVVTLTVRGGVGWIVIDNPPVNAASHAMRAGLAAALAAAAAAPISGLMFLGPHPIVVVLLIMAGLLFWRHAANIARLSAGTEGKIGGGKKADAR